MNSWLSYPKIQAVNCGPQRTRAPASLIVVHTIESPERPGTARGTAEWFGGKRGVAPRASAHFCIGQDEVVQCVALDVVSWAAPGVNSRAINLEHEGRASQTREQWGDAASLKVLERSAKVAAECARIYGIPPVRLDAAGVKAGLPGFCGHADVTKAYPERGHGHWDPGTGFPWAAYLAAVADELAKHPTDPAPPLAPEIDPRSLPVLKVGSTGEHVRLLQERLRYHARPASVDGVFGWKTHAMVADFQASRGVGSDGIVGAVTWALLLEG